MNLLYERHMFQLTRKGHSAIIQAVRENLTVNNPRWTFGSGNRNGVEVDEAYVYPLPFMGGSIHQQLRAGCQKWIGSTIRGNLRLHGRTASRDGSRYAVLSTLDWSVPMSQSIVFSVNCQVVNPSQAFFTGRHVAERPSLQAGEKITVIRRLHLAGSYAYLFTTQDGQSGWIRSEAVTEIGAPSWMR